MFISPYWQHSLPVNPKFSWIQPTSKHPTSFTLILPLPSHICPHFLNGSHIDLLGLAWHDIVTNSPTLKEGQYKLKIKRTNFAYSQYQLYRLLKCQTEISREVSLLFYGCYWSSTLFPTKQLPELATTFPFASVQYYNFYWISNILQ